MSGSSKKWLVNDAMYGGYSLKDFTLKAVGKYGEVWVANNLKFKDPADPRNGKINVSQADVDYLLGEFDNNMYEKEISYFAPPKERKGDHGYNGWYKDDSGRTVILVDNIKDENYHIPGYTGGYVVGYFSSTISEFSDRNIMTIDGYDWVTRTRANAPSPFLIEGTFAHEFQHLLHNDTDQAEATFVDEGLADFAQYVTGYGHSVGHVKTFLNKPKNSMTNWGDQGELNIVADYGNAYLFQLYLFEQYGDAFTRALFQNQATGVAGINATFKELGIDMDFSRAYSNFLTALVVDGTYNGSDLFKFKTLDTPINLEAAAALSKDAPAWGTDYKVITPDRKIDHLYFKGIDFLANKWQTATDATKGHVLWANTGDEADHSLIKELDLTGLSTATLSFDTKYDIEEQWDFAAVQVSTDGGQTWKSLANGNTRSDIVEEGYPKIKENLPGLTGHSNGWTNESFDLSQYAGQKILVNFRYMTDWGTTEAGWYVSNIKLNDTVVDAGTSTAGFKSLEQVRGDYVNYKVQFVGFKKGNATGKDAHVKVLQFNDLLNMKDADVLELKGMLNNASYEKVVMMTTFAPSYDSQGTAPYDFTVVNKSKGNK